MRVIATYWQEELKKVSELKEPAKTSEQVAMVRSDREDRRTPNQQQADVFKKQGNDLYKAKKFPEVLSMYDKAIATEPNDMVYHNNKCAAWIEMCEEYYDNVLGELGDLVRRRHEINGLLQGGASSVKVAKAFSRMAVVHEKKKQYGQAIEMYRKSLEEDDNDSVRRLLHVVENIFQEQVLAAMDSDSGEEDDQGSLIRYVRQDVMEQMVDMEQMGEDISQDMVRRLASPKEAADGDVLIPIDLLGTDDGWYDAEQMVAVLPPREVVEQFVLAKKHFDANHDNEPDDARPQPMTAAEWKHSYRIKRSMPRGCGG